MNKLTGLKGGGVENSQETWRITIEKKMREVGKTLNEMKWLVKNSYEWGKLDGGCASRELGGGAGKRSRR